MSASEIEENERNARWFRHCEMEERFYNATTSEQDLESDLIDGVARDTETQR